jgi:hypothetical protein
MAYRHTAQILFGTAAAVAAGIAVPATAADAPLGMTGGPAGPASVELIDSSRLGCATSVAPWALATANSQCAFDSAARGARLSTRQEAGAAVIEAYATVARAAHGAFTPDQLLAGADSRSSETTDLLLVGVKGSAFDERVKATAEFTRTRRVVQDLLDRDWALADQVRDGGVSASLRFDARLVSTPRLRWSVNGQYRSVSDDYAVGRSPELARYFAMPGSHLSLSTTAQAGALRLTAGIEQRRTPYGRSATRKAGADMHGVSLRWSARDSTLDPGEGAALLASRTRLDSALIDVDSRMLAASLLPGLGELPFLVPATVAVTIRSGETQSRSGTGTSRYDRSSLGIDGTWETPLGETMLSYWRDSRVALGNGDPTRWTEMLQASHFVRRGHWTFGIDAAVTRSRGDGLSAFRETGTSFGQSVAYSRPGGPEFRLQLGQDRGAMRTADDSLAMSDMYSAVTASLDLSRYLQKRFERDDLKLTLDYRRALDRSDSEITLSEELVERWTDGGRREGVLLSFGMKL